MNDDVLWYIYKLYHTHHVIPDCIKYASKHNQKKHFQMNIIDELNRYATGEQASKLINKFIAENPNDFYVREFSTMYWDTYYYMLCDNHMQKKTDLFLFTNFKDAIQALHIET